MAWLAREMETALKNRETIVVFMHAYPSEHGADAGSLRSPLRCAEVRMEKQILGTQLGPNRNGHGWPARKERERRAR